MKAAFLYLLAIIGGVSSILLRNGDAGLLGHEQKLTQQEEEFISSLDEEDMGAFIKQTGEDYLKDHSTLSLVEVDEIVQAEMGNPIMDYFKQMFMNPDAVAKRAVVIAKETLKDCDDWKGAKDLVDKSNLAMVDTQKRIKAVSRISTKFAEILQKHEEKKCAETAPACLFNFENMDYSSSRNVLLCHNYKCLQADGNGARGQPVKLSKSHAKSWIITKITLKGFEEYYTICHATSKLCMNAWGGANQGHEIKLYANHDQSSRASNARWKIQRVGTGNHVYITMCASNGPCIHAYGGLNVGSQMKLWGNRGYNADRKNGHFAVYPFTFPHVLPNSGNFHTNPGSCDCRHDGDNSNDCGRFGKNEADGNRGDCTSITSANSCNHKKNNWGENFCSWTSKPTKRPYLLWGNAAFEEAKNTCKLHHCIRRAQNAEVKIAYHLEEEVIKREKAMREAQKNLNINTCKKMHDDLMMSILGAVELTGGLKCILARIILKAIPSILDTIIKKVILTRFAPIAPLLLAWQNLPFCVAKSGLVEKATGGAIAIGKLLLKHLMCNLPKAIDSVAGPVLGGLCAGAVIIGMYADVAIEMVCMNFASAFFKILEPLILCALHWRPDGNTCQTKNCLVGPNAVWRYDEMPPLITDGNMIQDRRGKKCANVCTPGKVCKWCGKGGKCCRKGIATDACTEDEGGDSQYECVQFYAQDPPRASERPTCYEPGHSTKTGCSMGGDCPYCGYGMKCCRYPYGDHECDTDQGGKERYVCVNKGEVVSNNLERSEVYALGAIKKILGNDAHSLVLRALKDDTVSHRSKGKGNSQVVVHGKSCSSDSDCEKADTCKAVTSEFSQKKSLRCEATWLLKLWDGKCLVASHGYGPVEMNACKSWELHEPRQQWEYDPKKQQIKNKLGICLGTPESFSVAKKGVSYRGRQDRTETGKLCQKWSSQSPHSHNYNTHLDHNFCRNPDNEDTIWCYTTDPQTRWELCEPSSSRDKPLSQAGHVFTQVCDENKIEQMWDYDPLTGLVKNRQFDSCLDASGIVSTGNCDKNNKNQQWWLRSK